MTATKLIETIKEAIAWGATVEDISRIIENFENEALVHFGAIPPKEDHFDPNSGGEYREMPDLPGEYLDI